jgi:hypothetical protein
MSFVNGSEVFIVAGGASFSITTVFNSSNFNQGGDYVGPIVVAAVPFTSHRVLIPSNVGLEFGARHTELTTFCWYHYSIRNSSAHSTKFRIDIFFD